MTLPDGCTATVRQGALELSDGQRLPLPEAGGSVTIERRVVRPDGRAALVRHTIRVGEPADTRPDVAAAPADRKPTEVPAETATGMPEDAAKEAPTEAPVKVANEAPVDVVDKVPEQAHDEVLEKVAGEPQNEAPTEVSTEVPAGASVDVPEAVLTAAVPAEAPTEVPEKVQEVPADVPSEVSTETPIAVPVKTPADMSVETPPELKESTEVPGRISTEVESEMDTRKPIETSAERNTPTEEPADDNINNPDVTADKDKATPVSASLGTPLFTPTTEASDGSSAPEDAQPLSSAPDDKHFAESRRENLHPNDAPSPAKQSPASASESYSPLSGSSARLGSLSPVSEDNEPSFENTSKKLPDESRPFCEWSENESAMIPSNSSVPTFSSEAGQDTSLHGEGKSPVKEEEEEESEPVVKSRLTHHDSLRLPVHVPRLRKRSDGDSVPTDRHGPCGRRVAAHLNDPQKKQEENEEMCTKLNSILHKLGYGVPDNTGGAAEDHTRNDPSAAEEMRQQHAKPQNQALVEGPEEPEPVSVPKVISYFESITPQRMESPVERRKWRSSDRSPSASRSPRSARSPEPPSEHKSSAPPRKVNFADSVQRVFISSNSEPDEMEEIHVPRQEESSFSSPKLVQTCIKEAEPVICTQPTRLTTILVQNSPDKTPEDSKNLEELLEIFEAAEGSPNKTQTVPSLQVDPLSSNVLANDETPSQVPDNSATPATTDRTELKPSNPDHDKREAVTQDRTGTNEETQGPEDVPDSSETTPLITSSTAEELNHAPAPVGDNANNAATPVQAEPLPRPSSVILQGDLPLNDFPASQTLDPTDLPDGTDPVQLTADRVEEPTETEPSDPFLPDESVRDRSVTAKRSTWFEDCMEFCCCCWGP